ncbi:hypothetical protein SAMN05421789_1257, partial [Kaistella chaponensis]
SKYYILILLIPDLYTNLFNKKTNLAYKIAL